MTIIKQYNENTTQWEAIAVGQKGDTGAGVANGGITDQLLVKSSNTDFDTEWTSVPTVKGLQLDIADPADDATGRIIWNDGDGVPQFISNGTKVNLGLELLARCRNVTGNTIPKGTAVCIVGASANRISIAPSDRTTPGSACRTLGLTLQDILTDEFGKVSTFGLVRGLNTNAFDEGDELYVGETPGSLTTVEPTSPARRLTVGYVVTKNTSNGQIFVTLRRGVRVNEIDDVEITSLTDNDILRYSNANSRWENQELTTDLVDEGNTNLYYTNQRVINYIESDLSTDNLSEGNTNLYFTTQRVIDTIETETVNSVSIGLTTQQTNTAISEGSNAEILSQWSLLDFFSSKAIITAIGEGQTQISEFLITHDGTNTYMTEYGVLTTNGTLFTANSYISGNNLVIDVTSTLTSDTTFTIHETLFRDQASIGFDFNTDLQTGDGNLDLQQSFGSEDLNQ